MYFGTLGPEGSCKSLHVQYRNHGCSCISLLWALKGVVRPLHGVMQVTTSLFNSETTHTSIQAGLNISPLYDYASTHMRCMYICLDRGIHADVEVDVSIGIDMGIHLDTYWIHMSVMMYIYTYMHIFMYIYLYTHVYMHKHINTKIFIHVQMHIQV